ncbi:MAG: histidine--tRNA ligase [Candidatus Dasytiphilus stammeri]
MLKDRIQAIRGMKYFLPSQSVIWRHIEEIIIQVLNSYCYQEIKLPLIEDTSLFHHAIGQINDVVEKEMYTFKSRNGQSLTLRPEGTAGCVRAAIEAGLLYKNQEQRLWYSGPMFRYERPQKGRYRQFHQIGVEVFGLPGPNIDIELILLTARWWRKLGIMNYIDLKLNSIGSFRARNRYKTALISFLESNQNILDENSKQRMYTNPLRILDTKNVRIRRILNQAPTLHEYLDEESQDHFTELCKLLDLIGINYTIDPFLVRGLDYYNRTVFEWVTNDIEGTQLTLCAGGRYDGLVEQLGGSPTPSIGLAVGMERLVMLVNLKHTELNILDKQNIDVYLIYLVRDVQKEAIIFSEHLRECIPNIKLIINYGQSNNLKKLFSQASKKYAHIVLVLGKPEVATDDVIIKNLYTKQNQIIKKKDVVRFILNGLKKETYGTT